MPWIWVARTLGGEAAKQYGKRRAKKWAAKQAKKKGGRKLFPPTLGGPLGYKPKGKSKRGLGVVKKRPGRPKSRKTMRARSAPKPKMVPYRKGGCPPGYRYDPRRKMCIQNIYK
jgi:hypothetical protein